MAGCRGGHMAGHSGGASIVIRIFHELPVPNCLVALTAAVVRLDCV